MFLGALPGVNSVKGSPYTCATTYGTALFRGDAVKPVAAGGIEAAAANDGVLVCGVFFGCTYVDANGDQQISDYIPASKTGFTEIKLDVYDDPFIVYEVQGDGVSASAAEADRFATANHVAGAGSTTTGLSGHELDSSDIGTGLQLRILERVLPPRYTPNDWGSANVKLQVIFNEHFYSIGGGATV
jgi:hypothetical protein